VERGGEGKEGKGKKGRERSGRKRRGSGPLWQISGYATWRIPRI